MPRPEEKIIKLTIDGREVQAIEGTMLVDAAKQGDVEIPYFCYEPKLGEPVGACRMCLVEIEGIPKLQTSCSTAVKDGMVVHTESPRVRDAQNAMVEFLLVNHPLDCPVCDKGGECPLQDITFGWGRGISRVIEPKRHFVKPLALSPLIAIDRERCILCYRCVRFSQEIAEDWQLIFTERGAHTFVGTHDGHPYVAPFSGNIIELCPVGALTCRPYRFRARPWDIEGAGGICTLCPSQCNVEFTVRDDKVSRVLARREPRRRRRLVVRQGPLRLPGDPRRSSASPVRWCARARDLREVSWSRALEAASAIAGHRGRVAALVGGQATNEEAFLLGGCCARRSTPTTSTRGSPPPPTPAIPAASSSASSARWPPRRCRRPSPTSSSRIPCWCSAPSRWTTRRSSICGSARACAATASSSRSRSARPSTLDPNATLSVRYAPGDEAEFLSALESALSGAASSQIARV